MLKKLRKLFCLFLISFLLVTQASGLTNSFFSDRASLTGNSVSAGDWTRPRSEITSTESLLGSSDFKIDYNAEDNALDHVELWYSFNLGSWQHFGNDIPHSPGDFDFNSPGGDGTYQFLTVAVDQFGNVEDKNGNDIDDNAELGTVAGDVGTYTVQVDTQPPTMNMSLDEFGDNRWAGQNFVQNGSFENGMNGWVATGEGDHHVVSNEGNGNMFVLGFKDSSLVQGVKDAVWQLVNLPVAASANLNFDYRVLSNDTVDYDWFSVWIKDDNDFPLEELLRTGSEEKDDLYNGSLGGGWSGDSGWRNITHSLQTFAGRAIKLWFEVRNSDLDTGPERTWAYIDEVEVTTLDNRITSESNINFDVHDGSGSGVSGADYKIDSGSAQTYDGTPVNPDAGDHSVINQSSDLAGNQEEEQHDEIVVLPNVVLNKFSAAPSVGDEWVELFNNDDNDIDVNGWKICDELDQCQVLSGSTLIASKSNLRFTDDFQLNNDGDKVILKNSTDEEIDAFAYEDFDGAHDQIWQREPDGIGTWELVKPSLEVNVVSRLSNYKITMSVFNIPDNYGSSAGDAIGYEITYKSGGVDKGIAGNIGQDTVENGKADRDFVLGACSAGGVCQYDSVDGNVITVAISGQINGSTININKIFNF